MCWRGVGGVVGVKLRVGCPYPPVCNNIVTPHHLLDPSSHLKMKVRPSVCLYGGLLPPPEYCDSFLFLPRRDQTINTHILGGFFFCYVSPMLCLYVHLSISTCVKHNRSDTVGKYCGPIGLILNFTVRTGDWSFNS